MSTITELRAGPNFQSLQLLTDNPTIICEPTIGEVLTYHLIVSSTYQVPGAPHTMVILFSWDNGLQTREITNWFPGSLSFSMNLLPSENFYSPRLVVMDLSIKDYQGTVTDRSRDQFYLRQELPEPNYLWIVFLLIFVLGIWTQWRKK